MIDASAKKMADEFFAAFDSALTGGTIPEATALSVPVAGQSATAYPTVTVAKGPVGDSPPFSGGGFSQELYRVFWFGLGAAFTLLLTRWLP
ncbi:hypothetical protein IMCC9480_1240 [Oxalobacteraceae bacterium IMCC9480]|nr:hypothetical protein IMCC9480_1240 [Oxalobacteraceae bacterium IMCC9480]